MHQEEHDKKTNSWPQIKNPTKIDSILDLILLQSLHKFSFLLIFIQAFIKKTRTEPGWSIQFLHRKKFLFLFFSLSFFPPFTLSDKNIFVRQSEGWKEGKKEREIILFPVDLWAENMSIAMTSPEPAR